MDEYGIMVRRIAALRLVGLFLSSLSLVGGPIAVGEDAIAVDGKGRRDKYMVDAACREAVGIKIVEGSVFDKAQAGIGIGVFQYARMREDAIDLIPLVHIEITREHGWCPHGHLAYAADDEFGPLATRHHTHMVHVDIEEEELLSRALIEEFAPGADSHASSVPSQSRSGGSGGEPEMPLVEQGQRASVVEYGGVLSCLLTVITPYTDIVVVVEAVLHVLKLPVEHLLCAEDIGMLKVDQVADHLATLRPDIAGYGVFVVAVADIVRAYVELLGRNPGRQHQ